MEKTVANYRIEIVKALKANNRYSKGLDLQIQSLATAMRTLDIANTDINELDCTYVYETTRYGEKMVPHPVFKVAKDAQDLITRQLKALGLTAEDLAGDVEDDPLVDLTKKLSKKRTKPVILKREKAEK